MSRTAALRQPISPAAPPPARAVYDVAMTHAQLLDVVSRNSAPIKVRLETVLENTSSCFKAVIADRQRTYHRRPDRLATVFAHVDRAFALVDFEDGSHQLLLPLDVWVLRAAAC
jgi:hypothetical protein